MEPNDFLVTRLNQITEAVVQKNWGRAYELIEEWEADERTSPYREPDHIPADGSGLQFEELAECFN